MSPGSSRNAFSVARNSAAGAPSTARWSQVSVTVMSGRGTISPSTTAGRSSIAPTARIAACGGFSTAMNCVMPKGPRFEIVNVPPSMSCWESLPARARATRSTRAAASSANERCSAPAITGTKSASPTAIAEATLALPWRSIASPPKVAFTAGWRINAMAAAFVRTSDGLIFASPSWIRATRRSRRASVSVMSIVATSWKAGTAAASVSRRTIVLRRFVSGTRSTAPGAIARTGAAAAGAGACSACSTSSATMRPSGPVPRTCARSTPFSRAIRRASGEALMRPPASV